MTKNLDSTGHVSTCIAIAILTLSIFAIVGVFPIVASGDETEFLVKEHLGFTWTNEVVTYPFSAKNGLCVDDSVKLIGPAGPQACQLSEIQYWPGTKFVKSANISFIVPKLDPQTTQTYTVNSGPKPTAANPKTDLKLSTKPGQLEATTTKFGIRLLVGKRTYDPAIAPEKVPAPVQSMRLSDGKWFGGSRLFGSTPIVSYDARVVDSGPVFVRVVSRYAYADGNTLEVIVRLNAGGDGLAFETNVAQAKPADGWNLRLTPGLPALTLQFPKEAAGKQNGATRVDKTNWLQRPVNAYAAGTITKLSPWGDWWDEFTQPDIFLQFANGKRELSLVRRDAGRWVEPVEGGEASFGYFSQKNIPLVKQTDGTIAFHINNVAGFRAWSLNEGSEPQKKFAMYPSLKGPAAGPPLGLNDVKDMVLDWPEAGEKHPWLIMNAKQMATAAEAQPADTMSKLVNEHAIKTLEGLLARRGEFDLMRKVGNMAGQYDVLIDSELITPTQRKLLRARMAYLAYYAASPANWSKERGYRSGNPNMTIAHTLNQGVLACLLKDHPMAKQWAKEPTLQMQSWLDKTVDDDGYWNESSHYARVSISKLIFYAIAAQQAGFGDFLTDPKFKRMCMLYERLLTPGDPQRVLPARARKGEPTLHESGRFPRVSAPHGRGERGDRWGMGGLLARAQQKLDPPYAAVMQWSWKKTEMTYVMGEGMGGLERLYADPKSPEKAPNWESEYIRRLGYLLRNGTGTNNENFLLFISQFATNPDGEIWPSETGAITKWFARGVPLSGEFNGYPYSNLHSLLLNRVMPAASYQPGKPPPPTGFSGKAKQDGFATLSRLDYASAEFELTEAWSRVFTIPSTVPTFPPARQVGGLPMNWQRQLLSVKDDNADGISYIICRDTVSGRQPTQWHFWTLSEMIGSSTEVSNRQKFLADAPGEKIVGPRVLKGDRFTAIGQFGMDLEYYVASPVGTPRHTVRYGQRSNAADLPSFAEYQDLLQLTLPSDGNYFVAMYPHKPNEQAPTFSKNSDGKVITIHGEWGTDYAFLSKDSTTTKMAGISFEGTASSVQDRRSGLVLALGAAGSITAKSYTLAAPLGAALRVEPDTLTIELSTHDQAFELYMAAPGKWKLQKGRGVVLDRKPDNGISLGISKETTTVVLVREK